MIYHGKPLTPTRLVPHPLAMPLFICADLVSKWRSSLDESTPSAWRDFYRQADGTYRLMCNKWILFLSARDSHILFTPHNIRRPSKWKSLTCISISEYVKDTEGRWILLDSLKEKAPGCQSDNSFWLHWLEKLMLALKMHQVRNKQLLGALISWLQLIATRPKRPVNSCITNTPLLSALTN